MLAQPLFFFHEILSHALPARRLSSKCTEGWLVEAAKRCWSQAMAFDQVVGLEHSCLMRIIISQRDKALPWIETSPYIRTAKTLADLFPACFWRITASLLTLSEQRPLDEYLMVLLNYAFRDPHGGEILEEVVSSPWVSLQAFLENLCAQLPPDLGRQFRMAER